MDKFFDFLLSSNSIGDNGFVAALLLAAIIIYFLPSLVCAFTGNNFFVPVFLLNLFAGWTFLGWLAALILAAWPKPKPVRRYYPE